MIDAAAIKDDTQSAIDTLEELQSKIEAVGHHCTDDTITTCES